MLGLGGGLVPSRHRQHPTISLTILLDRICEYCVYPWFECDWYMVLNYRCGDFLSDVRPNHPNICRQVFLGELSRDLVSPEINIYCLGKLQLFATLWSAVQEMGLCVTPGTCYRRLIHSCKTESELSCVKNADTWSNIMLPPFVSLQGMAGTEKVILVPQTSSPSYQRRAPILSQSPRQCHGQGSRACRGVCSSWDLATVPPREACIKRPRACNYIPQKNY